MDSMRSFVTIDSNNIVTGYQSSTNDVISSFTIEVTQLVTNEVDLSDFMWRKYENGSWSAEKYTVPASSPLDLAKNLKIDELLAARNNALETFTSSALGTLHTYLSRAASVPNDMLLLTSEYSFAKSTDYDGLPLPWYSVEDGNTMHTGAQIIQVYLDARKSVQTKMLRDGTKNAQVGACTTTDQVATIGWPNPNPPLVPTGLAGTAGTTGSGQVALNWTVNTDVTMLGGGGYNVYVDGVKTNAALITGTTYTATGLAVGAHTFTISAVDTDGLESAKCTAVSVTTT